MTRVLHVYRTYFPDTQGGLEETIRQICSSTSQLGIENRVFFLGRSAEPAVFKRCEAEAYRFPISFEIASCGFSVKSLVGFKHLTDWADVIHYHFPWPFADLLHCLIRPKQPFLITYHSDIVRQKFLVQLYRPLRHLFLKNADCLVATSGNYAKTSKVLKQFQEKIEIIPIGLDKGSYPLVKDTDIQEIREKVGEQFFLFIGVLRHYKGLHILLDAVVGTNLKVVIVGSGPVEKELKKQAKKLGLTNVTFLGRVDDIEKIALIKLSKAIVFPSCQRSEAFGVTLLEGLMYGKALISTELGTGTSFVNLHGETGLVIPPLDVVALRKAMDTLNMGNEMVMHMGRAAFKRYADFFTGDLMGERYSQIYAKLMR